MASWDFPGSLEVGGVEREIRTDYRVILDLMEVFADDTITDVERANVALSVFYFGLDLGAMPGELQQEAIDRMMWFVRGGKDEDDGPPGPRLMDWGQDFHLIVGPINRVLGYECRAVPYDAATNTGGLHWWTFLAAYMEIGECYFQQVVSIRAKRARGKKLDKSDEDFYRKHRADVDLKRSITSEEEELLAEWITGR